MGVTGKAGGAEGAGGDREVGRVGEAGGGFWELGKRGEIGERG